jgi:hypothetical protein
VAAGETVYWKVRLAKGQILRVKATVDTSQIQTESLAPDFLPGLYALNYRLDLFTPLREPLGEEFGSSYDNGSKELEGSTDAGAKTGTVTSPRVLGFEQILASDYDKDKFPAPGEWFVSLSVADQSYQPAEIPLELPVDVEVEVIGAPQPSSPDFARSLPGPQKQAPSSSGSGSQRLTDLLATADQPADPALTIPLVAAIALVGGLGLGALAIVVLRLGRRGA